MDGTPTVFFEDLFDIGTTSKRFTHLPTSTTDLPQRSDIANLVWCYQNLNFKGGSYLVRWQAADAVVIERSGKALICANDNYTTWQNLTGVQTAFADGTVLKDYSGATTTTRTVYGGGKVDLAVPPCDGTAPQGRRGYAVWAPNGITTNYNPAERTTTQEWEMANDLGDNDTRSLREGGATPNNSTAVRTVGKIYVKSGKPITYNLYPTNTANALQIGLLDAAGTILSSATGTGNLTKTYTPTTTGWLTIKMRNQLATVAGQSAFVKVTYTAPKTPNALAAPGSAKDETDALVSEQWGNEADNHITLSLYPNPVQQSNFTATISSETSQQVTLNIIDAAGRTVYSTPTQLTEGKNYINISPANTLYPGVYLFNIAGTSINEKLIITQ
jgi:alpha-amylase